MEKLTAPSSVSNDPSGLIFDIQGHSVHDGPGCRTLIFLSGCPLDCLWCSNPEGKLLKRRLLYRDSRCNCGKMRCVGKCPYGAIRVSDEGISIDREKCPACCTFECASYCYEEALQVSGRYYSVDELLRILQRDRFYWGSKGGVTFGGGEPLLQKEFIRRMLVVCRENYIHTAVETTAYVQWEFLKDILEMIEWVFVDVKHMDPEKHKKGTGIDNRIILDNVSKIAGSDWGGRMIIRHTVVPGFNDDLENAAHLADFMKKNGLDEVNLLSYHRMGESKYRQLGMEYEMKDVVPPSVETREAIREIYESRDVRAYVDYDTPF